MEFIKCSNEELNSLKEKFNLERWNMSFEPFKIIIDSEIVGLIECYQEPAFGKGAIMINNFEVFKKRQGVGSAIIKSFLQGIRDEKVYLYFECESSKNFWGKQGFHIEDDGTGTEIMCYKK